MHKSLLPRPASTSKPNQHANNLPPSYFAFNQSNPTSLLSDSQRQAVPPPTHHLDHRDLFAPRASLTGSLTYQSSTMNRFVCILIVLLALARTGEARYNEGRRVPVS